MFKDWQYHAARGLGKLLCCLPYPAVISLGRTLGPVIGKRLKKQYERGIFHIMRGMECDRGAAEQIMHGLFQNLGQSLMEILYTPKLNKDNISQYVTLEHPERLAEFRALLDEAYAVAIADGVQLPSGLTAEIFEDMMHYRNADATSSMARDAMAHKPTELETFSGHLVRLADRLGVPAPVSKRFYQELLKREVGK